jgi:hypothetical protein
VFANERYADWLLFKDKLDGRVAYDVRFELFPSKALERVVAFRTESGNDWQRAARGFRLFVLDPDGDRGAIRWLRRQRGATVLYRGKDAVVLESRAR